MASGKNLDVMRAIHWLEEVLLIFISLNRGVLTFLIIWEMPRCLVELNAANVRCENRLVAALEQFALHEILQLRAHDAAFGHP